MFFKTPNLPNGAVSLCILSGSSMTVLDDMRTYKIETIIVPPCENLALPIASHADMLCFHKGENKLVIHHYSDLFERELLKHGVEFSYTKKSPKAKYPLDILCNSAMVSKYLICNSQYTDSAILDCFLPQDIINVKQGYAKCSTLIVDEKSIITADYGIAKKAADFSIEALLIHEGDIRLNGYPYGFIGGCGVKLDVDVMYFTGKLATHRDADAIRGFLSKRKITILEGSSKELVDIGSIIPLC